MKNALRVINDLKREKVIQDYAIGGAVGALFYSEPAFTQGLDILVAFPESAGLFLSLAPIYEALKLKGYRADREYLVIEGIYVQFLPANDPLLAEALTAAVTKRYDGLPVRVMRAEHLLAIALQTGRPKDKARVSLLMEQAEIDRPYLDGILGRFDLMGVFEKWMN